MTIRQNGYQAFIDGLDVKDCPHQDGDPFTDEWSEGWWSAYWASIEALKRDIKDQKLDDPRRGQAKHINAGRT